MSTKLVRNTLVPGWILIVGLICLNAPPRGVGASLSMFLAGMGIIPALLLIAHAVRPRTVVD